MHDALNQLRALLVAGHTWRCATTMTRIPKTTAFRRATRRWPELKGRRPQLCGARREAIRASILDAPFGLSLRQIARDHCCSVDTVCRYARDMIEAECRELSFGTRSVPIHICPGCRNLVRVSPCVICEARNIGRAPL